MAATLLMPRPSPRWSSREGVGDDGRGVGEEHGAAHALADPHGDEPDRTLGPGEPGHRQEDGEDREDGEAEVEDLDPAEHVAHAAQADDQHGQHDHEAHQHPQHVAGVAGRERVEVDAAEDVRQRNEDDRLVDEHHQRAQGDGGEGDPPVMGRLGCQQVPGGGPAVAVGQGRGHSPKFNVNVRVMKQPGPDSALTSDDGAPVRHGCGPPRGTGGRPGTCPGADISPDLSRAAAAERVNDPQLVGTWSSALLGQQGTVDDTRIGAAT